MGRETLKDLKWYPEFILNDLVTTGQLSPKRAGYDITDRAARRFFYDKKPFALLAWKQDDYAIVAFAPEILDEDKEEIVCAFVRVLGYVPFVRYETFQNKEDFAVVEWTRKDSHLKMIEIMQLPHVKNIHKIGEEYYKILQKDTQA